MKHLDKNMSNNSIKIQFHGSQKLGSEGTGRGRRRWRGEEKGEGGRGQ